jgi:MOSC domain-containing protein YiiM
MTGTILQINVSPGGIPKRPIPEATVTRTGVTGDSWAHPHIHGGPNQAILLICSEAIEDLRAKGFAVYPGALGENLTIAGIDRRQMRIGQRYRAGETLIELTKLRAPCDTLTPLGRGIQAELYDAKVKAGDPTSPRWAMGGFYAAVRQPGIIRPHDIIALVDQAV